MKNTICLAFMRIVLLSILFYIQPTISDPIKIFSVPTFKQKIAQIFQYSRHFTKIAGGTLLCYLSIRIKAHLPTAKQHCAQMIQSQGNLLNHTADDLNKVARFLPKDRIPEIRKNAAALFSVAQHLTQTSIAEQSLPIIAGLFGLHIASQGLDGLVREIKNDEILIK